VVLIGGIVLVVGALAIQVYGIYVIRHAERVALHFRTLVENQVPPRHPPNIYTAKNMKLAGWSFVAFSLVVLVMGVGQILKAFH
jgi:hypothetical protein